MPTTFYMPIDVGFVGTSLTLYATQGVTSIDSAVATINELPSGDIVASATLDLSTAVAGTVNLSLRNISDKALAWTDEITVSAGGAETTLAEVKAIVEKIPRANLALTDGEAVRWLKTNWTNKDNITISLNKV